MTHTVESLMALAFDAMDAARVWAVKNDDLTLASLGRKREALRSALTEALAPLESPLLNDYVNKTVAAELKKIQAAQPEQSEREAFEAYALKTICANEDLQQRHLTGYGSQELNYLWRGWHARASLQSAQPVREPQFMEEVAYEHIFADGSKVLSYALSSAGFPPRTDATQVNLLYYSIDGIGVSK